jgi:hypothetical protein
MIQPFRILLFSSLVLILMHSMPAQARIDTAVLTPVRQIQAYIYNSADLTLIKDSRIIHFARGMNQVRFSWSGTRIDPTSLSFDISDRSLPLEITQTHFPARETNQAVWHINAIEPCRAEVVIRYFTSGISWQPHYTAILSSDQTRMQLTGQVRINNRSGMDYPDARVMLVTGEIHLLDRIADLAGQPFPYGRPDTEFADREQTGMIARGKAMLESAPALMMQSDAAGSAPGNMDTARASDYVVYSLDGEKTLSDGGSDALMFLRAPSVPVATLYVSDTSRFKDAVIRMVTFTNDTASGLGSFPLPGGIVRVYQAIESDGGMVFAGTDTTKYIPADSRHQLRIGPDRRITATPRVMGYAKTHLTFDTQKNLSGFDEVRTMALDLANFSDQPARIDIFRTAPDSHFSISGISGQDTFEKIDQHRFKFSVTVPPGTRQIIHYTLTAHQGDRKW